MKKRPSLDAFFYWMVMCMNTFLLPKQILTL